MITRKATAKWLGNLKTGNGKITSGSQILKDTQFTFSTRFENVKGTNPEELLGSAYAACFSMELASKLTKKGFEPLWIKAEANVSMDKNNSVFSIENITIDCEGDVPGIDEDTFKKLAEQTQNDCIISRALASVKKEVNAKLTVEH